MQTFVDVKTKKSEDGKVKNEKKLLATIWLFDSLNVFMYLCGRIRLGDSVGWTGADSPVEVVYVCFISIKPTRSLRGPGVMTEDRNDS